MRAEGLPVEVGLVIVVNELLREELVVVVARSAVFVVSDRAELGFVDVCVCAADAAPVRRERPAPRSPSRPAATIRTRAIAANAQNALSLRLLKRRLGVWCNSAGSTCFIANGLETG